MAIEFLTIPFDKTLIDRAYECSKSLGMKGGRTEYITKAVQAAVAKDLGAEHTNDPNQMEIKT